MYQAYYSVFKLTKQHNHTSVIQEKMKSVVYPVAI